jgi:hypothetical protein
MRDKRREDISSSSFVFTLGAVVVIVDVSCAFLFFDLVLDLALALALDLALALVLFAVGFFPGLQSSVFLFLFVEEKRPFDNASSRAIFFNCLPSVPVLFEWAEAEDLEDLPRELLRVGYR